MPLSPVLAIADQALGGNWVFFPSNPQLSPVAPPHGSGVCLPSQAPTTSATSAATPAQSTSMPSPSLQTHTAGPLQPSIVTGVFNRDASSFAGAAGFQLPTSAQPFMQPYPISTPASELRHTEPTFPLPESGRREDEGLLKVATFPAAVDTTAEAAYTTHERPLQENHQSLSYARDHSVVANAATARNEFQGFNGHSNAARDEAVREPEIHDGTPETTPQKARATVDHIKGSVVVSESTSPNDGSATLRLYRSQTPDLLPITWNPFVDGRGEASTLALHSIRSTGAIKLAALVDALKSAPTSTSRMQQLLCTPFHLSYHAKHASAHARSRTGVYAASAKGSTGDANESSADNKDGLSPNDTEAYHHSVNLIKRARKPGSEHSFLSQVRRNMGVSLGNKKLNVILADQIRRQRNLWAMEKKILKPEAHDSSKTRITPNEELANVSTEGPDGRVGQKRDERPSQQTADINEDEEEADREDDGELAEDEDETYDHNETEALHENGVELRREEAGQSYKLKQPLQAEDDSDDHRDRDRECGLRGIPTGDGGPGGDAADGGRDGDGDEGGDGDGDRDGDRDGNGDGEGGRDDSDGNRDRGGSGSDHSKDLHDLHTQMHRPRRPALEARGSHWASILYTPLASLHAYHPAIGDLNIWVPDRFVQDPQSCSSPATDLSLSMAPAVLASLLLLRRHLTCESRSLGGSIPALDNEDRLWSDLKLMDALTVLAPAAALIRLFGVPRITLAPRASDHGLMSTAQILLRPLTTRFLAQLSNFLLLIPTPTTLRLRAEVEHGLGKEHAVVSLTRSTDHSIFKLSAGIASLGTAELETVHARGEIGIQSLSVDTRKEIGQEASERRAPLDDTGLGSSTFTTLQRADLDETARLLLLPPLHHIRLALGARVIPCGSYAYVVPTLSIDPRPAVVQNSLMRIVRLTSARLAIRAHERVTAIRKLLLQHSAPVEGATAVPAVSPAPLVSTALAPTTSSAVVSSDDTNPSATFRYECCPKCCGLRLEDEAYRAARESGLIPYAGLTARERTTLDTRLSKWLTMLAGPTPEETLLRVQHISLAGRADLVARIDTRSLLFTCFSQTKTSRAAHLLSTFVSPLLMTSAKTDDALRKAQALWRCTATKDFLEWMQPHIKEAHRLAALAPRPPSRRSEHHDRHRKRKLWLKRRTGSVSGRRLPPHEGPITCTSNGVDTSSVTLAAPRPRPQQQPIAAPGALSGRNGTVHGVRMDGNGADTLKPLGKPVSLSEGVLIIHPGAAFPPAEGLAQVAKPIHADPTTGQPKERAKTATRPHAAEEKRHMGAVEPPLSRLGPLRETSTRTPSDHSITASLGKSAASYSETDKVPARSPTPFTPQPPLEAVNKTKSARGLIFSGEIEGEDKVAEQEEEEEEEDNDEDGDEYGDEDEDEEGDVDAEVAMIFGVQPMPKKNKEKPKSQKKQSTQSPEKPLIQPQPLFALGIEGPEALQTGSGVSRSYEGEPIAQPTVAVGESHSGAHVDRQATQQSKQGIELSGQSSTLGPPQSTTDTTRFACEPGAQSAPLESVEHGGGDAIPEFYLSASETNGAERVCKSPTRIRLVPRDESTYSKVDSGPSRPSSSASNLQFSNTPDTRDTVSLTGSVQAQTRPRHVSALSVYEQHLGEPTAVGSSDLPWSILPDMIAEFQRLLVSSLKGVDYGTYCDYTAPPVSLPPGWMPPSVHATRLLSNEPLPPEECTRSRCHKQSRQLCPTDITSWIREGNFDFQGVKEFLDCHRCPPPHSVDTESCSMTSGRFLCPSGGEYCGELSWFGGAFADSEISFIILDAAMIAAIRYSWITSQGRTFPYGLFNDADYNPLPTPYDLAAGLDLSDSKENAGDALTQRLVCPTCAVVVQSETNRVANSGHESHERTSGSRGVQSLSTTSLPRCQEDYACSVWHRIGSRWMRPSCVRDAMRLLQIRLPADKKPQHTESTQTLVEAFNLLLKQRLASPSKFPHLVRIFELLRRAERTGIHAPSTLASISSAYKFLLTLGNTTKSSGTVVIGDPMLNQILEQLLYAIIRGHAFAPPSECHPQVDEYGVPTGGTCAKSATIPTCGSEPDTECETPLRPGQEAASTPEALQLLETQRDVTSSRPHRPSMRVEQSPCNQVTFSGSVAFGFGIRQSQASGVHGLQKSMPKGLDDTTPPEAEDEIECVLQSGYRQRFREELVSVLLAGLHGSRGEFDLPPRITHRCITPDTVDVSWIMYERRSRSKPVGTICDTLLRSTGTCYHLRYDPSLDVDDETLHQVEEKAYKADTGEETTLPSDINLCTCSRTPSPAHDTDSVSDVDDPRFYLRPVLAVPPRAKHEEARRHQPAAMRHSLLL